MGEGKAVPEKSKNLLPDSITEPVKSRSDLPPGGYSLAAVWGKSRPRILLPLACGLVVMVLLFRRFDWKSVIGLISHSSLPFVLYSAAALIAFQVLRSLRWELILRGRVPFLPLFIYSSIGTLISLVTGAQSGEFVKPALVRSRHGLPYFVTAASVAVERLLDVATLFVMGLWALLALPTHTLGPAWIASALGIGGIFCAFGFSLLWVGGRFESGVVGRISKMLNFIRIPATLTLAIVHRIRGFLHGVRAALSPINLALASVCSLTLWGVNAASVALIFRAINQPVPSPQIIVLGFVILSFGGVIPLTPGALGQYEGLWLLSFEALHVGPQDALLAAGVLSHALIMLTIVVLGFLGFGLFHQGATRQQRADGQHSLMDIPES